MSLILMSKIGCLCNAGACHAMSSISDEDYHVMVQKGYVCGTTDDIMVITLAYST